MATHSLTRPAGPEAGEPGGASPFVNEFFLVQGDGFCCMAYRDPEGKWRGAFNNEELPGVIRVLD